MKLYFPEGSLPEEDITVTFKLPSFADVDNENNDISFYGDIITAVSFYVSVEGEVVSPYTFAKPIELTIPYKRGLLDQLGIDPSILKMFFISPTGELDSGGIVTIDIDEGSNVITGSVSHFSEIAVAPLRVPASVDEYTQPTDYKLSQNYPNPFNPETTITYGLPIESHVTITIYSILGQRVKTLVDEMKSAGDFSVTWDGTNESGERVTSGMYIYSIEAGNFRLSRKLMLMK